MRNMVPWQHFTALMLSFHRILFVTSQLARCSAWSSPSEHLLQRKALLQKPRQKRGITLCLQMKTWLLPNLETSHQTVSESKNGNFLEYTGVVVPMPVKKTSVCLPTFYRWDAGKEYLMISSQLVASTLILSSIRFAQTKPRFKKDQGISVCDQEKYWELNPVSGINERIPFKSNFWPQILPLYCTDSKPLNNFKEKRGFKIILQFAEQGKSRVYPHLAISERNEQSQTSCCLEFISYPDHSNPSAFELNIIWVI